MHALFNEHIVAPVDMESREAPRYVWWIACSAGRELVRFDVICSMGGTRSGCGGLPSTSLSVLPNSVAIVGAASAKMALFRR